MLNSIAMLRNNECKLILHKYRHSGFCHHVIYTLMTIIPLLALKTRYTK